jgi:hypothetical protein
MIAKFLAEKFDIGSYNPNHAVNQISIRRQERLQDLAFDPIAEHFVPLHRQMHWLQQQGSVVENGMTTK